jgi:hypothetical protein
MMDMKKMTDAAKPESVSLTQSEKLFQEISEDLEISQRTQRPPSEDLILRLNQLASQPPFCYTRKVKENYPL